MTKIKYKTYSKQRWWLNNINNYIKIRCGSKEFFTGKILGFHNNDDPLEKSFSNYWFTILMINYNEVIWNYEKNCRGYKIEHISYKQIHSLKLLNKGEEIIFKLQLEINKNAYDYLL